MNHRLKLIVAVIMIAVITLSATVIVNRVFSKARIADLTEDHLYALSGGTLEILKKLNQPVTLKLYYSRQSALEGPDGIRFWNNYFLYVRDLLEEYATKSNGQIKLEILDPKTFSVEEEQAVAYGLKRYDLRDNSFIFGLAAVTALGKEGAVAFFEPQRQAFVEYDVSKLISDLTKRQKLSVGIVSGLPILGDDYPPYMMMMLQQQGKTPKQAWGVVQRLKDSYDVFEAKIKDGAFERQPDYLLVVHPKGLDQPALFAIDQYVMNGGKAAIFVDPVCLQDQPQQPMNPYQQQEPGAMGSELNALLVKWGLSMDKMRVVADPAACARIPVQQGLPAEPFPPFLSLTQDNLSRVQPAVAGLHNLQLVFAGSLENKNAEGIALTPLIFSTREANLWTPDPMQLMRPPRFSEMIQSFKPIDQGVKNLAVLLTGKFKTNFPDGIEVTPASEPEKPQQPGMPEQPKKEEKKAAPKKLTAIKETAEPGMLIVVSDVDMLTDQFAFRPNALSGLAETGENAAFLLNIVDFLGGSTDLMAVRTRGDYLRPFTVIDQIEREAEKTSAGKVEALNTRIREMEKQLNELVNTQAGKNPELLKKGIIEKKREVEGEMLRANRELRQLQQQKRETVQKMESRLEFFNMLLAPSVVLLIALGLWLHRRQVAARCQANN